MTQGLIPGGTNYSGQTLGDIKNDIEFWKKIAKENKELFETTILQLSKSGYWGNKVPFSFRVFCQTVPQICTTIINDFDIILKDIDKNNITKRTVKLMRNIANIANENEEQSWRTYKEDHYWKEYSDKEFSLAENLYKEGRDFFCTLIDVGNAAARVEDYMTDEKGKTVIESADQSVHITDNSIRVGDGNTIKSSVIGKDNETNTQKKESKLVWKIIVPIFVGVAVVAICLWLGLK